jgi:hypothetical protein
VFVKFSLKRIHPFIYSRFRQWVRRWVVAPQSCLTAIQCFTQLTFIRQRTLTCTRRNLSFWHLVRSLQSDYLNSAYQLQLTAVSCHEPVMFRLHVACLDKSCLKLAQNWIIDCPLKRGVSSIGLTRFGLLQVTEEARFMRYYAVST